MSAKSNIEWCDATWSPVVGCTKVSPGCDHCYAETMSRRLSHNPKYALATKADGTWSGVVSCHEDVLDQPLRWKKPRMIFVCSMSDLFHSQVPWDFIVKVFDVMAATSWHTYQVLTKRPGRMAYFAEHIWPKQGGRWEPVRAMLWKCACGWSGNSVDLRPNPSGINTCPVCGGSGGLTATSWPGTAWPQNVWAGTSVESQKYAPRLECLARVPARVRFVSVEPMLGPVDLRKWTCICQPCTFPRPNQNRCGSGIQWLICGGESGPKARPMHPDWPRSLRDQCQAAAVPFFFKQWGEWAPRDTMIGDPFGFSDWSGQKMVKVGKKAAGARLDGREWREMPQATRGSC